jgi:hypothetical protein
MSHAFEKIEVKLGDQWIAGEEVARFLGTALVKFLASGEQSRGLRDLLQPAVDAWRAASQSCVRPTTGDDESAPATSSDADPHAREARKALHLVMQQEATIQLLEPFIALEARLKDTPEVRATRQRVAADEAMFRDRLESAMATRGISTAEELSGLMKASLAAHLSPQFWTSLLQGKSRPQSSTIRALEDVFGCELWPKHS